jgi:hypothetical protein
MHTQDYKHIAALIEEAARHARGRVDLTDAQVDAFMGEFVAYFAYVM